MTGTRPHLPNIGWLYNHRYQWAQDMALSGECVVGVVGADVPRELVLATGGYPVRLHGESPASQDAGSVMALHARAAQLLGSTDEPTVQLLARILSGELSFLAGIAVSRERDANLRLYYVLRELAAHTPGLPPVHLVDLLHLPRPATAAYNRAQVRRLIGVLRRWTGRSADPTTVASVVQQCTSVREQLHRVQHARIDRRISGTEALHLFAAAETLEPAVARDVINARVIDAQSRQACAAPGLFLSGSPHETDIVYAAIEDSGWQVVGEDHDRGSLALTIDVHPAPEGDLHSQLDALAAAYGRRGPDATTASASERARWADAKVRHTRAEAVLSYVRRHDEASLWDHPRLRASTQAEGVPAVLLRDQGADPDAAQLRRALGSLAKPQTLEVHP